MRHHSEPIPQFHPGDRVRSTLFGPALVGTVRERYTPNAHGWYQVLVEWDSAPGQLPGMYPYTGPERCYAHSVACLRAPTPADCNGARHDWNDDDYCNRCGADGRA